MAYPPDIEKSSENPQQQPVLWQLSQQPGGPDGSAGLDADPSHLVHQARCGSEASLLGRAKAWNPHLQRSIMCRKTVHANKKTSLLHRYYIYYIL